ncbi:hypothetical protein BDZ89DRAFT_208420 [Hymenopellis radicata]|nr:hypothetical protein BDZ89DRAFT_208420 [Hymenopellis radicata]
MAALENVQYLRVDNQNLRSSLLEVRQERDDMQREASGLRCENEQLKLQRRDLERELAESKRMIEHLTQACHCHKTELKPEPSTPTRKRKRPQKQVSDTEIDVDNFVRPAPPSCRD